MDLRRPLGPGVLLVALLVPRLAWAAEELMKWMNNKLSERVAVVMSTRSNTNQSEAPSMSSNTSSLVDTSSASDLIGIALNLAGLTGGTADKKNESDATSTTATVSSYMLYTALQGADPLDHDTYCAPLAKWARGLSFTLGFDDQSNDTATNGKSRDPIVAGAKFVVLNGRDVCDDAAFGDVRKALVKATGRFAGVSSQVGDQFFAAYPVVKKDIDRSMTDPIDAKMKQARQQALAAKEDPGFAEKIEFLTFLDTSEVFFKAFIQALGDEAATILDTALGKDGIDPFVALTRAAQDAIEEFQQAPQVSVSFLTKQRSDGDDDYQGQAILDLGLAPRLNLTANASYEGMTKRMSDDAHGGRVAGQLQYQPFPDNLSGPKPLRLSLGFEGAWMTQAKPTYKGQVKINLPIPRIKALTGIEIPLSVTIANRSDLIDETEVRGLIGFTVDTSQMLAALMN